MLPMRRKDIRRFIINFDLSINIIDELNISRGYMLCAYAIKGRRKLLIIFIEIEYSKDS